jgi:NAD(P)-dependent dehydrogenase (short-subunit alcohol dehydrogenase family)
MSMIGYGLKDRGIVITGGASGIGLACANLLAAEGARIALIDISAENLQAARAGLEQNGAVVSTAAVDVSDYEGIASAFAQFDTEIGEIYGAVLAAGISGACPAEDIQPQDFARVMDVNVNGVLYAAQQCAKRMIPAGSGSIVTISSIDGIGGHPARSHYTASKHAVVGLTRNFAVEWGRHGIRVNTIAPNAIDTPLLWKGMPKRFAEGVIIDRTPMARLGKGGEVATVALMLLSDAASYVSGVVIPVDGGLSAGYYTARSGADYSNARLLEQGVYSEQ